MEMTSEHSVGWRNDKKWRELGSQSEQFEYKSEREKSSMKGRNSNNF